MRCLWGALRTTTLTHIYYPGHGVRSHHPTGAQTPLPPGYGTGLLWSSCGQGTATEGRSFLLLVGS